MVGKTIEETRRRLSDPCTSSHVANWLLDKAEEEGSAHGKFLTQIQLNKLAYFAYGFYAGDSGKKMFQNDIEAWKHGPVVPTLYHEFKRFRYSPITKKENGRSYFFDEVNDTSITPSLTKEDIEDKENILDALNFTWAILGNSTSGQLIEISHDESGPWCETIRRKGYSCDDPPYGLAIPFEKIEKYFKKILQNFSSEKVGQWWRVN